MGAKGKTGVGMVALGMVLVVGSLSEASALGQKDAGSFPGPQYAAGAVFVSDDQPPSRAAAPVPVRGKRKLRHVVDDMKKEGYSLDEIVRVLKEDRRKAAEISIACLNNGFNGTYVHAALRGAGFAVKTADAAVPVALRRTPLLFPAETKETPAVARNIFIEPNPFRPARTGGRRPEGVPHVIATQRVGVDLVDSGAGRRHSAAEETPADVLWDSGRTFEERRMRFREVSAGDQARFFALSSPEERAQITEHLSAAEKDVLYQSLPRSVRVQSKSLFQTRRVEIEVADASTATHQDVHDLINWLSAAEEHMDALGIAVTLPEKIIVGPAVTVDYATAHEWLLSIVTFESVGSRLIQVSLAEEYPDLGYQAIEAFVGYYLDLLLAAYGVESTADGTPAYYQVERDIADSTTLYQAYAAVRAGTLSPESLAEMVREAAANYRAIGQAIQEIALVIPQEAMLGLVRQALKNLSGISNPRGAEIVAAFLEADRALHKGEFRHLIRERFAAHTIHPEGVSF